MLTTIYHIRMTFSGRGGRWSLHSTFALLQLLMPVDPNVILSQLATSWSLLMQSVNQVLQASRSDPHHIHPQSNDLAQFENVFKLVCLTQASLSLYFYLNVPLLAPEHPR